MKIQTYALVVLALFFSSSKLFANITNIEVIEGNVKKGVEVQISFSFEKKAKFPVWYFDSRDYYTEAFRIKKGNIQHGRLSSQGAKKSRATGDLIFPANFKTKVTYVLDSSHEVYMYEIDKDITNTVLELYHIGWPDFKAFFKIDDKGNITPIRKE